MKASTSKAPAPLDLSRMGNLASMLATPEPTLQSGQPLELRLDKIKLRPQVRTAENPGLSPESIAEIGASIKARGVKTPISVCEDPDNAGEYFLNHGERRYRGSLWAEKVTIPAFVDNDHDEDDQIVENIQREGLTARELADYVGRKLSQGTTQAEIAAKLGKSKAYVSQYAAMLNLPEPVAQAVTDGRITDVTVANELARAYKENPKAVTAALEQGSLAAKQSPTGQGEEPGLAAKPASARVNRDTVKTLRTKAKKAVKKDPVFASGDVKRVERALSDHLATKVTIRPGAKGSIELVTQATSWDHFNSLMEKMSLSKAIESDQ